MPALDGNRFDGNRSVNGDRAGICFAFRGRITPVFSVVNSRSGSCSLKGHLGTFYYCPTNGQALGLATISILVLTVMLGPSVLSLPAASTASTLKVYSVPALRPVTS